MARPGRGRTAAFATLISLILLSILTFFWASRSLTPLGSALLPYVALVLVASLGMLVLWMVGDCLARPSLDDTVRLRWLAIIVLTAPVGTALYYQRVAREPPPRAVVAGTSDERVARAPRPIATTARILFWFLTLTAAGCAGVYLGIVWLGDPFLSRPLPYVLVAAWVSLATLVVWLLRDCALNPALDFNTKFRWSLLLLLTLPVGTTLYYLFVMRPKK